MSEIFRGLDGVVCQLENLLVFGIDEAEHDARPTAVLKQIESARATLNLDKCDFSCGRLKFLGHLIDRTGIQADPEKRAAIREMKPPSTVS